MTKFYEACLKMNDGDIFETEQRVANIKAYNKGKNASVWFKWIHGEDVSLSKAVLELEGKIITADPKVLSATELWGKVRKNAGNYEYYKSDDIDYAIDISHNNGRLEMWLEFKKKFTEKNCLFGSNFDAALEELKPHETDRKNANCERHGKNIG